MFRTLHTSGKLILVCGLIVFADCRAADAKGFGVLYSFKGGSDGAYPFSGVIIDGGGNLLGTTYNGGNPRGVGCGTVFKVTPGGSETVLHTFVCGSDANAPYGGLTMDRQGNLFGTTLYGGSHNVGAVYKLAPDGTETVIHSFTNGKGGNNPSGMLVENAPGDIFGTTSSVGQNGYGTLFRLTPGGKETVLHAFTNGSDGGGSLAGLVQDRSGNLYGSAVTGGAGYGTVYALKRSGGFGVLHAFTNGGDGGTPYGGVVADSQGNLYGTTDQGGGTACGGSGCGTVFKIAPDGTLAVLHSFAGGKHDGATSYSNLAIEKARLFGTTYYGGRFNAGTVFRLAPDGTETVLYSFTGRQDGGNPLAGLVADGSGNLYGTASVGGASNYGVVFKITE